MTQCLIAITWSMALVVFAVCANVFLRSRSRAGSSLSPPSVAAGVSPSPDSSFFQAVLSQYLVQDTLHWSHVNTLAAIQAATLAGGYVLWKDHHAWLSASLVTLGFLLTVALGLLIERIKQVRDVNRNLLESLGQRFDPRWILNPDPCPAYMKGDGILFVVILGFLAADVAFLVFMLLVVPCTGQMGPF
jgi:hypothetical protein